MLATSRTWQQSTLTGITAGALAILAGCSGGGGTAADSTGPAGGFKPGVLDRTYEGSTISVMMPPWGSWKESELKRFTAETGIEVNLQTLAWDSIHDKVVTTAASGQAPADVVEMDWTWVAQFGAAGWFTSLDEYLSPETLRDSVGASAFRYEGQQIGIPYNLDFRGTEVNLTMLQKAGISSPPRTWDETLEVAEAVKKAGVVSYPIGLPLSITEGTATPWYALVRSAGGLILTEKGEPAFDQGRLGADALQFIRDAYAKGLIDPGAIGLTDQQVNENFIAGQSAIILSTGPAASVQAADPANSKIAKDTVQFVHVPGDRDNTGATIGLVEGLSIPKTSKNKEAAAMFITWWLQTPQLLAAQQDPDMGAFPPTQSALKELAASGELLDAPTILEMVKNIEPVIPGGAPTWYSKFSAAAAATIQSVALGQQSADAGAADLAKKARQFSDQGK